MASDPEQPSGDGGIDAAINRQSGGQRKDGETRTRVDEIAIKNEDWRNEVFDRVSTAIRWSFAGVAVAIVASTVAVAQWRDTTTKASQNEKALCAYRGDLEASIRATNRFLAEHPEGLPGISTAAEIKRDNERRKTVAASFRFVDCRE